MMETTCWLTLKNLQTTRMKLSLNFTKALGNILLGGKKEEIYPHLRASNFKLEPGDW